MATYEFKCPQCGHRLEITAHITEIEGRREFCPYCGEEMRRLFNAPSITFKGSGWASKDLREKQHDRTYEPAAPASDHKDTGSREEAHYAG